jgi:hypothetical protein
MSEQVFQLKLPMRMKTNKRGDVESLNLNIYRNLHFYQLSYQKEAFQKSMRPVLSGLPQLGKVKLHYEIHPKSSGRLDTMNVGAIVDKYFSDALVESGIIEDDDYKNVIFNSFCFGSVSPKDPHVLVTITETEPRGTKPMRVLLDKNEIQTALENFVKTLGLSGITGVDLSANDDGQIIAEIVMGMPQTNNVSISPAHDAVGLIRPKRGGRPLGSKNKPKEDDGHVETAGSNGHGNNSAGASESAEEEDPDTETDDESGEEDQDDYGLGSSQSEATPKPNPFGGEDADSSNPSDDEEEESTGVLEQPPVERVKKSSIFDE